MSNLEFWALCGTVTAIAVLGIAWVIWSVSREHD